MRTWGKIKNAENSCIIFLCRVDKNKVQKIHIYLKAIYYYLFKFTEPTKKTTILAN